MIETAQYLLQSPFIIFLIVLAVGTVTITSYMERHDPSD